MTTKAPPRRRRLSGESMPYFASAAHLVDGDVEALLLLSLLSHLAGDTSDGWVRASAEDLETRSALSRRKQERARRVLSSKVLLEERLEGMPARLAFRPLLCFDEKGKQVSTKRENMIPPNVETCFDEKGKHASTERENMFSQSVETGPHQDAVSTVPSASSQTCIVLNTKDTEEMSTTRQTEPPAPSPVAGIPATTAPPPSPPKRKSRALPLPTLPLLPEMSPLEVAKGALDHESPQGLATRWDLATLALGWWASVWGKRAGSVALTPPRRKVWTAAFAGEARKPSAFFAAIVGMTHDPWPERDGHNDWPLLLRHLEKWAEMGVRAGFVPALRPSALPFPTKDVGGVVVPENYDWQSGDDYCRAKGERFDPRTREWVRRDDPRWATLGVVSRAPGGFR
jgi:hypothetical protein